MVDISPLHSYLTPDSVSNAQYRQLSSSILFELYCTVMYCTVRYLTVRYCTVLYCTVLVLSGRREAQPFHLFYHVISDIDVTGVITIQQSRNLLMNMGTIQEKKRNGLRLK
jgi:hypothetical protein